MTENDDSNEGKYQRNEQVRQEDTRNTHVLIDTTLCPRRKQNPSSQVRSASLYTRCCKPSLDHSVFSFVQKPRVFQSAPCITVEQKGSVSMGSFCATKTNKYRCCIAAAKIHLKQGSALLINDDRDHETSFRRRCISSIAWEPCSSLRSYSCKINATGEL